jgi:S1-C subfamily serine protease
MKIRKLASFVLAAVAATSLGCSLVAVSPEQHRKELREQVSSRVFEVVAPDVGGGTGFQVEAPSGTSYILTNSHVCELVDKQNSAKEVMVVTQGPITMKRRVLAVSDRSDLCLLEGVPAVKGLELGSAPKTGDWLYTVGHPQLGLLTMLEGEVRGAQDISIVHHAMKTGNKVIDGITSASDEPCDLAKEHVETQDLDLFGVKLGTAKVCVTVTIGAYTTSISTFPGSSGSPAVDAAGKVVGVVFAANDLTHWGFVVSNNDVRVFLKGF